MNLKDPPIRIPSLFKTSQQQRSNGLLHRRETTDRRQVYRWLMMIWVLAFTGWPILSDARVFAQDVSSAKSSSTFSQRIDSLVTEALAAEKMPGAVVCIGQTLGDSRVTHLAAYGHSRLLPKRIPMKTDTLFDLASLTKPIATATSVMILLEEGKVRLRDPVARYLPEFGQNGKSRITVQQLLTHTGGLIPDNALRDYQDGPELAFQRIHKLTPKWDPGSRFAYTDVGFITLGEIVRKVSGTPLDQFARDRIFQPLGMNETTFNPGQKLQLRAAVTQRRDGEWMQGTVHDPRAYELGGVAGHAGLFSTAGDLKIYCEMLLAAARTDQSESAKSNAMVLSPRTVELMSAGYELPGEIYRGLGWDKNSPYSSNRGELMTKRAFGHGGFTGTAVWVDPGLDLYVIFLSNRVHPDGKGSVNRLAGQIGTVAAAEASRRQAQLD